MPVSAYPWFDLVTGDELEQGDLLEACPVFLPPADLVGKPLDKATFRWEKRNVIILSQSCDMVKGREKISEVLTCAVWGLSELTPPLNTPKLQEEARRGNLPSWHVLAECVLPNYTREIRFVDLRRVYSLPVEFVRQQAQQYPQRLRLLPPYREHLSQSFARFFMRVGLPVDIPRFIP